MSTPQSSSNSNSTNAPLELKRSAKADILVIESGEENADEELILASNPDGGSLTLLEEYSIRENNNGKWAAVTAFVCAVTSLAFAYSIYSTL